MVAEPFRRLGTDTVDLLQIHNMHGTAELMPTLRKLKDEQRIRCIGATTARDEQYPALLAALREHWLDFIQVDYSIDNRNAAAELLPAVADQCVAALANMPFGDRRDGHLCDPGHHQRRQPRIEPARRERRAARCGDAHADASVLGLARNLARAAVVRSREVT
jgi:aryl-alcohol dehydrogenase-like predicted oxidoreductase